MQILYSDPDLTPKEVKRATEIEYPPDVLRDMIKMRKHQQNIYTGLECNNTATRAELVALLEEIERMRAAGLLQIQ